MRDTYKAPPPEKEGLHPRNKHRKRYNFDALIKSYAALAPYVSLNQYQDRSIDFADPDAVKMLNKALLIHYYGIASWDIPQGYLCPPIPGRADYIHYTVDLLAENNGGTMPKSVKALDIGVGANCIYPIIGRHEYGWDFVGVDIDPVAIRSAEEIVSANKGLKNNVELRIQTKAENIFNGIIKPGELFDLTICNPPFHASLREAEQAAERKLGNLGNASPKKTILNFGGQSAELWYPGGESAFIRRMIEQSVPFAKQCFWFTTLVSKKENLKGIYHNLEYAGAFDVRTITMKQGQKTSRVIAWTLLDGNAQSDWRVKRWTTLP